MKGKKSAMILYNLEYLEGREFLMCFGYDVNDYIVSFELNDKNDIDYIHIENIDRLSLIEINKCYDLFDMIKAEIIERVKEYVNK